MRTILVLFFLGVFSIPVLLFIFFVQFVNLFKTKKNVQKTGRTVLLTGAKMTKCLQLARMFHSEGNRVIVVATPLYKYCGTRFSNAIDAFKLIPTIQGDGEDYRQALIQIANEEKVDLFVPVSSPKSALYEAMAKPNFPDYTEVFQFDENIIEKLDDKHQFIQLSKTFGLSVPESYNIESKEALLTHEFTSGKRYILKKIDYDPVYRLDLRTLPHEGWQDRVKSLPISAEDPWVLQEYIDGKEVCTHTTTRNGYMNLYVCSDSSPFQVNYAMLHLPRVKDWVQSFVRQLNATGQISFDFIIDDNDRVIPIECNPRTHSAITLFHNQHAAIAAYSDSESNTENYVPNQKAGHTYWLYHELFRLTKSGSLKQIRFLLKRMRTGKEAVFQLSDPWPFYFNNHVSIPYQIIKKMLQGVIWTRIDFNIGKIIVPGGD